MQEKLPLSEYPRPQLVRDSYICLNGYWDYAIKDEESFPEVFDGKILVPYSPETKTSGVERFVSPEKWLFYRRYIDFPNGFIKDKVILHFGAVDQIADIYLNGEHVCHHEGGYLPFEVDIKPYIKGKNELIVKVKDYSETKFYCRGKQRIDNGGVGIWYSCQSGIWLPVWMESVSEDYIESLKITPDFDNSKVVINVKTSAKSARIDFEKISLTIETNKNIEIEVPDFIPWTPENPHLYEFKVSTENDYVQSYFAMRKISFVKDERKHKKIALNNKEYFVKGVLDQGYYKDSLLTPRSDEDYINDIKTMKEMGFNTLRKHIKVESLRYYYYCDKFGMLVWQDFLNGGDVYNKMTIHLPLFDHIHHRDTRYKYFARTNVEGREMWLREMKKLVEYLYNSPCIFLWTIFNEGWGQFDAKKVLPMVKEWDYTRLIDPHSGWHDQYIGDFKSLHVYYVRARKPWPWRRKKRCFIYSEIGGYILRIKGHDNIEGEVFGYKAIKKEETFLQEYKLFIEKDIKRHLKNGLSAFIYTQLSDVENELNGFITFDREVVKIEPSKIKELNELI